VVAAANDVDAARSVFVGLDAYPTVPTALAAVRASGGAKDTIVLKDGIHYLNQTMTLIDVTRRVVGSAGTGADRKKFFVAIPASPILPPFFNLFR
jgi:hypothetical protein